MVRPGGTEVIGTPGADLADLAESLKDFCCGLEVMGGACSCCTRLEARLAAEAELLLEVVALMGAEEVPRPPSLSSTVFRLFLLTVCIPCAGAEGLDPPPEDSWTGLRLDMTGPGGRDITLEALEAGLEAGRVCWAIT